jgi:uncharacterized protein (TIGR00251 family)
MIRIEATPKGVRLAVHVQPRASRNEVAGVHDEALKVRLQAPPVDGAANEALIRLIAESLGVRPRQVRIARGGSSRQKEVEILGVSAAAVASKLSEVLAAINHAKRAES